MCRQFWCESVGFFFSGAVFDFDTIGTLALFAKAVATQAFTPRIHRLSFRSFITHFHYLGDVFGPASLSMAMDRFESLEGTEWTLLFNRCNSEQIKLLQDPDVLGGTAWKRNNIASVIRAFQQRKLRKDLTSVTMRDMYEAGPGDTNTLTDKICKFVLQNTS